MKFEYRGFAQELEIKFENESWQPLLSATNLTCSQGEFICAWVGSLWSRMPGGSDDKVILPDVFCEPKGEEVTFYPGSFNPWHEGHSACVSLTPTKSLVVVPDANPWKEQIHSNPWRDILSLAKQLPDGVTIFPGFWSSQKKNPTVDWLPKTAWKNRNLTMGADSFLALSKWKQPADLLKAIEKLFVVPRNIEIDQIEKTKVEILELAQNLHIEVLPGHAFEKVSSSEIRK